MRSCLPGMARGTGSARLLAWPFVRLCRFWLRAGSRTVFLSARRSWARLGLLGEEAQLGQRHLLPQPGDLPEHGLCCRQREGGELGDSSGSPWTDGLALPWLWAGQRAGTLGSPSSRTDGLGEWLHSPRVGSEALQTGECTHVKGLCCPGSRWRPLPQPDTDEQVHTATHSQCLPSSPPKASPGP